MADLTRRGFLAQMSITTGVGIAGGLGLRQLMAPHPQANPVSAESPATVMSPLVSAPAGLSLDGVSLAGPMVVHVRDVATAEVALMVGTQELIYRDPELVARLVTRAAQAEA